MKKPSLAPSLLGFLFFSPIVFSAAILHAEGPWDDEDRLMVSANTAYVQAAEGNFAAALEAEQNALQAAQDRFGPTHPSLAPFLTDLATLYRKMARYAEAESALRWALALREKNLGLEDPLTAQSLDQLAALDSDLGRFEEAEVLEKRAVGIDRKTSPIPPGLASLLIHAGEIDLRLQKNAPALEYLSQGLALIKNAASPAGSGPLKVEALWASARADLRLGKIPEASAALRQALNVAKQDSPSGLEQGDALMRLADFDLSQKNQVQASAGYQSAFKIYQHFVGPDTSYATLPYISRLAQAEEALGNEADAMALWKRVLETSRSVYGPAHPQTAVYLSDLAWTEENLGDPSGAAQHLQAALAIFKSLYDPGHPLILETSNQIQKLAGH